LRISVSRGVGSKGYLPTTSHPNWVLECIAPSSMPEHDSLAVSQYRRTPPSCLPTACKTAQGLGSSLALMDAQDAGFSNALMLTPDGMVSEAANANIYWENAGQIYTPALSTGCVSGVIRTRLMQLGSIEEVTAPLSELLAAECVMLSNSRAGLLPVRAIGTQTMPDSGSLLPLLRLQLDQDSIHYARLHAATWNMQA